VLRTLIIDAVGGVSGDMLLSALLDAGAPRDRIEAAVSAALGRDVAIATREVRRGGLRALALEGLDGSGRRRGAREQLSALANEELAEGVRSRARDVVERLFAAEARVHGVAIEDLELQELGEEDTLFDVVGIASALDALGVDRIGVSSIPMPMPQVQPRPGDHGVPAPVVLELLRGFRLRPSDADGSHETVTPTGAAVLAALAKPAPRLPRFVLEAVGTGAGHRDPAGMANVVRVLVGTPDARDGAPDRELLVLEANVDDLSPELVPVAVEALLEAGALDAWITPVIMKRGRPGIVAAALCAPEAEREVRRAFFESTTTLGVRMHSVMRPELDRYVVEMGMPDGGPRIRVKVGSLDGRPVSAKPELEDVVEAARKLGRPVRSVHDQARALAHRLVEGDA
jgi:uncharacterized protein (TIGR00299 family) protein